MCFLMGDPWCVAASGVSAGGMHGVSIVDSF